MSTRILGLACLAALLLVACDSPEVEVQFTEPGTMFEVDPGDEFVIVLESNPTTGFSWTLEVEPPSHVVRFVSGLHEEPDTDLVGAPVRQMLRFEAVGEGTATIQLWYVRAFEDPPANPERAEFEVRVGDAISVSELLSAAPDERVYVTGLLFDDGSGVRLCDVLAESFPPQCVGEAVVISNPELIDTEYTEEAGVRWTDHAVTVFGELSEGEFDLWAGAPQG